MISECLEHYSVILSDCGLTLIPSAPPAFANLAWKTYLMFAIFVSLFVTQGRLPNGRGKCCRQLCFSAALSSLS